MNQLNTTLATTIFNVGAVGSTTYTNNTSYSIPSIPNSTVTLPKPVSYDFRVAEYVDAAGNIKKVGLQYRVWEHDSYGVGNVIKHWTDVERVKLDYVEEN